jgi:5-methylcytosine-specific restriction endonuclease McrBC GTP-binding regulatory subunit McrB
MAERSKELIMVGYFLSRFGKNSPPSRLNISKWKDAYKIFYDKLSEGRSVSQFEHSLKNSRDAFDGYFSDTEREGWKADDGSPSMLSGYSLDIYNDYENLSEDEVFLKIESFISKSNKNHNFSWVPTYKAIVQFLKDKQNDQAVLLQLLKDSGCDVFNDQYPENSIIELDEIDPFSFFCYLNKYFKQRLEILQKLAKSINAPIPKDDHGIPSANPQKVWLFPYKYMRNNNEIDRLWKFFHNALENTISDQQFEDVLHIRGVALTKITEALFYIAPETYFPINGPTKPYLEEVLGIDPIFKTFTDYKSILDQIKSKSDKPFYQLSYEAWQWNDNLDSEFRDFQKSIEKNSNQDLEFYFDYLEELTRNLNLNEGDNRVVFSCKGNYLNFNIGQRVAWRLDPRKGRRYHIMTDQEINENSEPFDGGPDHYYHVFNERDELTRIKKSSLNASIMELSRTTKSGYKKHNNKYFEKVVYDKTFRNKFLNIVVMENEENTNELNQIFFGPPGTGKTFHTINEAIKIADPEFYKIHKNDREQLKARFKLLSLKNDNESVGQIGFTTFHQSFSYEDFIEGIKPNEPKEGDAFLKYEIQEGVFKKICRLANDSLNAVAVDTESLISLSTEEYEKAHFYKMSLGNTQDESDNEIYEYCIENNCISIGFGNQLDFTGKDEKELRSFGNDNDLDSFSIQAMNLFSNYLKIGNYVVISYGNKYVRAVGKVTGDYKYRDDSELPNNLHYKHFRSVEWIFTDEKISANEIYNKNLSQQTIYKLDKKYIKQEFFVKEKKIDTHRLPKNPKNFVLVVDEINRGNVSSVFGELITLIEKDKRAGADEELSVTLPYSKETFSVPHNVYIIGTMNTADRSIEALDTALRRRFSFREMPPKPELIKTVGSLKSTNGKLGDIDVVKILKTINNRIEKLIDKDHKIGHSYFLNISSKQDLIDTFRDKVIPLLEEYFFGDFGKISLVLGSSFISKESADGVTFATSNDYDPSIANDLLERSVYEITSESSWDFKAIYE